jgi:hypothetical protein
MWFNLYTVYEAFFRKRFRLINRIWTRMHPFRTKKFRNRMPFHNFRLIGCLEPVLPIYSFKCNVLRESLSVDSQYTYSLRNT